MVGIDISQFNSQVDSLFICGTCKRVSIDPLNCTACSRFYCQTCVKSKNSPCCKNSLETPSSLLMRFYNALKIVCQKCKEIHSITEYLSHKENCPMETEIDTLKTKISELKAENNSLKLENTALKKQLEEYVRSSAEDYKVMVSPPISPKGLKQVESNSKPPSSARHAANPPKIPKQDHKPIAPGLQVPKKVNSKQVKRSKTVAEEALPSPKRKSSKDSSISNNPQLSPHPYNENLAATIIQRAFRKRNKAKIREAIMVQRQLRMNKTSNKKVREDAKKACNDVQDLVKNIQSSPYKFTEKK